MNKIIVISILLSIIPIGLGIDAYAQSEDNQLEKWKKFIKKYKIWANNRIHDYKDQIKELEKTIIELKEQNQKLENIVENGITKYVFDDYKVRLVAISEPKGLKFVSFKNPEKNYGYYDNLAFKTDNVMMIRLFLLGSV